MNPNHSHIAGLELALQQWNNGGPAAHFAALLRGLIEQAQQTNHSEHGLNMVAPVSEDKAQEPVQVDYVAVMHADGEGGLEPEWLLEGGTAELMNGMYLCCLGGGSLLFEGGHGQLYAAPVVSAEQQGVADGYPHEEMDALATARFKVGASSWSVMPFAVRAGDGDQEIYRGSKSDCESVARKLVGAFLDGGIALIGILAAAPAPSTTEGQGDE